MVGSTVAAAVSGINTSNKAANQFRGRFAKL
jgi:hypothetical protein